MDYDFDEELLMFFFCCCMCYLQTKVVKNDIFLPKILK